MNQNNRTAHGPVPAAGRTPIGLCDAEAVSAGFDPRTTAATADDHKAYYPGAEPIAMRWTADRPRR